MESTTLFGLFLGFLAIIISQAIDGVALSTLVNIPAFILVVGGTFAAVLLQTPAKTFKHAFKLFPLAFYQPPYQVHEIINMLGRWSRVTRQFGLFAIEDEVPKLKDKFLKESTNHLLSGNNFESIYDAIEVEIDTYVIENRSAAMVFESMGGYAPTIGIIGAVLGLIQVMQHLSDPSLLGKGIAMSFIATVYGVGLANLIFLPLANKLKSHIYRQARIYEMFLFGLKGIANGDSPSVLNLKLQGFQEKS